MLGLSKPLGQTQGPASASQGNQLRHTAIRALHVAEVVALQGAGGHDSERAVRRLIPQHCNQVRSWVVTPAY